MGAFQAALWGVIGGGVVEALEHAAAIRRVGGWPWTKPGEPGLWPSLCAVILRLAAGAGLAAASGATGQVAGALGAFSLGVTAPLVVEKMFKGSQAPGGPAEGSAASRVTTKKTAEKGTALKKAAAKKAATPPAATNPSNREERAHGG